MITAIVNKLKTGTLTNVSARYDGKVNLIAPYIIIWEDTRRNANNGQSIGGIYVSVHVIPGFEDTLNNYINYELLTLLHNVTLTDSFGNKFRLEDTNELSIIVYSNDDGTISRDRLFSLPILGAI